MYQYLKESNIVEVFRTSKSYTEGLTDNFPEYERLARNKPHASIPKEYPKTTDGTTASIIKKTPHRIIQQLPTGKVKSDTEDWLSVIAEFIYTHKIIPSANEGYALLQKCWLVVERFLTYGSCPTYVPFVEHGGYFCTDLRLPHWGDIFLQPGKLSDEDSSYIFLRSWWQPSDIESLIDAQTKLSKDKRTWNVDNLKRIKDFKTTKDEKAKTQSDKQNKVATETIELITGFQRGVKAKFFTFHVSSELIARTKLNKDPRGDIPSLFAYGDVDGSNPLGRSVIDLVGPMQNLLDGEMQMYQYNRALQLNPPLIKRGNFSKSKIKFAPNIIIDVGSDPNATVEPLVIDTTSLQNFPNNYGLMKTQMLNLLSSPDTSTSADVGNPGFSKTDTGVKQIQANVSIDDNYVRKQFETWFERWSETAINLYFAEREGIEELQLDRKSADRLREMAMEGKFDPALLSDDNRIRINYSSETPKLKFEVDASSSKVQDELRELQSLEGLATLLDKSQFLQSTVPPQKKIGLWNAIVDNSGTSSPEKLKMNDKEIQNALSAEPQKPSPRENVVTNFKDLPPDSKQYQLKELGFPPSNMLSPVDLQAQNQASQGQTDTTQQGLTPEHVLKAHGQVHQEEMDKENLNLDKAKLALEAQKVQGELKIKEKIANKPVPKPVGGKNAK